MADESRVVLGEAERFASISTPPASVPLGSSAGAEDSTVCNLKTIRRENKEFPWPPEKNIFDLEFLLSGLNINITRYWLCLK